MSFRTEDDENDYGYPEYRERNDKEIAQLKQERDKLLMEHEQKKEQGRIENEKRRKQGLPPLQVESDEEFFLSYSWIINETKIEKRPDIFDARQEEER